MSDSDSYYSGSDDGSWSDYSGSQEEKGGAAAFEKKLYSSLWQIAAFASAVCAIGAMIYTAFDSYVVIVMACISIPVSALVAYTESVLESIDCKLIKLYVQ